MGIVLNCLAKKPPSQINGGHFAVEEEGFRPRRRERQLRIGDDGEIVVIGSDRKFEPTPEMTGLQKELDTSRAKATAALVKLLARKARLPDLKALKNFRKLAGDVAYLERMCENAERQAREQFEAEEKRKSGLLFQHREVVHQPMLVSLEALVGGLEELRAENRTETEAIKAETRRRRELRRQEWRQSWLDRLAENVKAEASSAYAEDEIDDDDLRRAHEVAGELTEATTLAAAASTAYAEDLISEESLYFLRRVGL